MLRKTVAVAALLIANSVALEARAEIELSGGFSFNRTNYSEGNFSWTRRAGGSIGYRLSLLSSIEFSIQEVVDRTRIIGFEDTVFTDNIYSINWVQNLFTLAAIQPYFKVGAGQLNRSATGTYANGSNPNPVTDSLTAVLGLGTRVFVTRGFAIRAELMSYLTGGNIGTYRDNVGMNIGLSLAL
ncbi:MAG: hypothetical protein ACK5QT_06670 [Oligoflexia bacterium]|jgi:hypothetical protein